MPVPSEPLHNLEANLNNTGKHIVMMTAVTPEQAVASAEMAAVAVGGEQALREQPILSAFQCSVSPLVYDGGPLAAAVEFAKADVPSGFMVMPILGATSPITRAGTMVVNNAEVIGGVIAHQLLAPGARTFYASAVTTMDLWSGAANCGGPEDLVFQMSNAQLARAYGLKSMVGTFATGSKTSDWQGGVENALSGFASWIAGVDMASGAGLLYAARVFSAAQLVLDAEVWDLICSDVGGDPELGPRIARGRRDRRRAARRTLPRSRSHADAHARGVAVQDVRPRQLGGLGGQRSSDLQDQGDRARQRDPRDP